jgi:hypothetical protein
MSVEMMVTKET